MLTEQELIELLRSQLEEAERKLDELADLTRTAYDETDNQDLSQQIEDTFQDLIKASINCLVTSLCARNDQIY